MTETRFRIVVAEAFDEDVLGKLRAVGDVVVLPACDEATLRGAAAECEALVVRTYSMVTRSVIDSAPRLRVIGRGGVGLENIDLDATRERGVTVVSTPAASTDAVADLTLGFMLALLRDLRGLDAAVRGGRFREARQQACAREMSELTVGVVGMGRIGRAVARRCRNGFGMGVLFNDIVDPGWLDFVAAPVSKEQLYAESDVVTLHVPLDDSTRGLIDATALARVKPGALLINTARGAVVDNVALAQALTEGRLGGAALDVFDPEPLPGDHPLQEAPNTLFTAHVGARTVAALARMNALVDDVIRVLKGQPPLFPAQPGAGGTGA